MMPRLKRRNAKRPAIGRSASAACADDSISVMPCVCSVTAVVSMMKNAIRFENAMPMMCVDLDPVQLLLRLLRVDCGAG